MSGFLLVKWIFIRLRGCSVRLDRMLLFMFVIKFLYWMWWNIVFYVDDLDVDWFWFVIGLGFVDIIVFRVVEVG